MSNPSQPNRRQLLKTLGVGSVCAPLLAGNAAASLNEDEDGEESEVVALPFETTAPDGTTLRGHVHIPDGVNNDNPAPTVLMYSPYWDELNAPSEEAHNHPSNGGAVRHLIDEGFIVAAISIRGTGDSDGCLQFGGPIDWVDVNLVIEKLANESYCNGRIGMLGYSYDGFSISMALAGEEPESLEAAVAVDSIVDWWSLYVWNGVRYPVGVTNTDFELINSGTPNTDVVDCPNRLESLAGDTATFTSGKKTGWYKERDLREYVFESDIPLFVTNGLQQITEAGGTGTEHHYQVKDVFNSRPEDSTRMLLGQWGHNYPDVDGFFDKMTKWFDFYLSESNPGDGRELGRIPEEVKPGVVRYEDDDGEWHTADSWPPEEQSESLYLSDGTLTRDTDEVEASEQTFLSVDINPGLSLEHCVSEQAVYVSDPVEEDVHLAGDFTLNVTLESSLDGGNLCAALYHTPNDGTCPDDGAEEFARMYADLRHWMEMGQPRSFPVDEPTEVEFDSFQFATTIPKGHRIVLVITGGSEVVMPDENQPELTIHTGKGCESSLELPVGDGGLRL